MGVGEYENYHGHFSAFDIAREIYGQMYLNIFSIHNTFLKKNQAVENYEVAKLLKKCTNLQNRGDLTNINIEFNVR